MKTLKCLRCGQWFEVAEKSSKSHCEPCFQIVRQPYRQTAPSTRLPWEIRRDNYTNKYY
jgi:hypothetical protein